MYIYTFQQVTAERFDRSMSFRIVPSVPVSPAHRRASPRSRAALPHRATLAAHPPGPWRVPALRSPRRRGAARRSSERPLRSLRLRPQAGTAHRLALSRADSSPRGAIVVAGGAVPASRRPRSAPMLCVSTWPRRSSDANSCLPQTLPQSNTQPCALPHPSPSFRPRATSPRPSSRAHTPTTSSAPRRSRAAVVTICDLLNESGGKHGQGDYWTLLRLARECEGAEPSPWLIDEASVAGEPLAAEQDTHP